MAQSLLAQLVLAYGAGALVVLVMLRLRVPTVVGFLLAGVLLGPHGLGLVRDLDVVHALADIGVVILLFTVGVEVSLAQLARMGKSVLYAGLLQMAFAIGGLAIPLGLLGLPWPQALVLGFLVAPTGTTLLMRVLGERGELDAPQGRVSVGACVVQDLLVIPIMVLLPLLAGGGGGPLEAGWTLLRAILVLGGSVALARIVVPRIFEIVANTRSRELFALAVIFVCLGTAYGVTLAGLSLALGAFLGGLVASESPYSQHVLGEIAPIRDGLSGLFFIGVGMLLDVSWVADHPLLVVGIVAGVIVFKVVTTALAVVLAGLGVRVAVLAGIALAQVSEFSFVVGNEARRLGILAPEHVQPFLATVVLSMLASPFVYRPAHRLADRIDCLVRRRRGGRPETDVPVSAGVQQHVVLVGYGLTGRNVGRALTDHGVPFVAIEMNPETVRAERAKGVRVLYGDAGHPEVLLSTGIERARLLVVAINDAAGSLRVVRAARELRPDLHLVVRARYLREVAALREAGAQEVVPDEVETSVEIFARVLKAYDLPADAIERSVRAVREDTFAAVRGVGAREGFDAGRARLLAHVDLEFHVVGPGAPAAGRTIGDLEVRHKYGVTVVAVRRAGEVVSEPGAATRLEAADVVVVMGTPEHLSSVAVVFRPPAVAETAPVEKSEDA